MTARASVYCLLLLSILTPIGAQTTGVLQGFVSDPSGAAVQSAAVQLVEQATNAARDVSTNNVGRYEARDLAPGRYRIEVSRPGFRTDVRTDVVLGSGRALRIDFQLQLGETREEIVVTGQAPLVSPSVADWGTSVTAERLESLPLEGRDLYDLAGQQPGAVAATTASVSMLSGQGAHISVNGARPNQNAFRVDGIYINDATNSSPSSASGALLGLESIQEVRLVTSPFSAEYGLAAGGIFTAVSKSGTNQVHGSVYEYLRNSAFDAKNFFDAPDEKIPPLRKNQFGAMLGGPLLRDKLFFMGNYEAVRQSSGSTARPATLTADARLGKLPDRTIEVAPAMRPYLALYPLPNGRDFGDGSGEFVNAITRRTREDFGAGKLDWILSQKAHFSGRYTLDDTSVAAPDEFSIWNLKSKSRYQFLNTEAELVSSPTFMQTFRAGFSRIRNAEGAQSLIDIPSNLSFYPGRLLGSLVVVGLTDLGNSSFRMRPRRYTTNDYQLSWDATRIHGQHTLRFGAGLIRQQFNLQADFSPNGSYRFDSIADLLMAHARQADTSSPDSDTVRGWRQSLFFGYFQDEVWLARRLQASLGVRYETYTTPSEVNGKVSTLPDPVHDTQVTVGGPMFQNPSRKNFGPRASLAWDPLGDGRTVVRVGAGIFFDTIGSRELQVSEVRLPPFYYRLRPRNPSFPDLLQATLQNTTLPAVDVVDYYVNQPYVIQSQFAIERQIGASTAIQLGYSGARGIHLAGRVSSTNTPVPQFLADGRVYFPANTPRINPNFDQIDRHRTQFNSFYHAFNASLNRQLSSGLRLQTKYTWAKSIDENSSPSTAGDFIQSDRMPQLYNYRANRGPSDFDIRHVFALNFSWILPGSDLGGAAGAVLGGWSLHGLLQAQTGAHFSPFIGLDQARLGSTNSSQRPDLIAAPGARIILGDPQQWFDPRAFGLPQPGFLGNLGRNVLTGPGLTSVDLALHKIVWKQERRQVQFRAEGFNVLNHPNFQVSSDLDIFSNQGYLGTAGRITETATNSRQIQLALKWEF